MADRPAASSDFPRFRLDGVLGSGAFSTVYRAYDERLEATVALKVLAENHSIDPGVRQRFLTEGRILRRVDSEHVVDVYDLEETPRQQPYLVLEYADRGDLRTRVEQLRADGWTPTADDLMQIARPVAQALASLHEHQVVHRDLNPGNMLIRSRDRAVPAEGRILADDERLLVADLGLCKDLAVSSGLTVAGGTKGFQPPEQQKAPAQIGPRADLWALSALMVWIATGTPPDPETVAEDMAAAGFRPELSAVLQRSLADDPGQRHTDVDEWLDELQRAGHLPPPPAWAGMARADQDRTPRPMVQAWRVWAIGLLALVVGLLIPSPVSVGGATDITEHGDGTVTVVRSEGDATVSVNGPEVVAVGATAEFTVTSEGVDRWVWLSPDGRVEVDQPELILEAGEPGVGVVRLYADAPDGGWLDVEHQFQVED